MNSPRSLTVQSILFHNSPSDIIRAAESTSNSVNLARTKGLLGDWVLALGDCSAEASLSDSDLAAIQTVVENANGILEYEAFLENLGSAAGHNRLAAKHSSDVMLILNPDALVAPDTLSVLCGALRDNVGIAEARQIPLEHPKTYEASLGDTSWASTACALVSRTAFDEVSGFDAETFFLYCDDVDFSWQLRLHGYRVVYEPAARVFHDKRLTLTGDWPETETETYYSAEAALLISHKYSRPDITEKLLSKPAANKHVQRARNEFFQRQRENRLPEPCDAAHEVGTFIEGNYAVHRF